MSNLCSVICVAYNHARFAATGLESIYDQSYRNIEIIVLDDGSSDSTETVIRQKLQNSPFPFKFITQENTGNVPANFNKALGQAKGAFVTFMSLDDVLLPDCISSRIDRLQSDENLIFAADHGYKEIDETGKVIDPEGKMPVAKYNIVNATDLLEAEYNEIGTFYIQGQVFRLDAIKAINGFDDMMTGDDIILRTKLFRHLVNNPEKNFHLGDATVFCYRKHDGNLHKRSFRQIKTVIEWKEVFFPESPYPKQFYLWLENFFRECVRDGNDAELSKALSYNSVVADHFNFYSKSWKMRRRLLKSRIKKSLGLLRSR